MDFGTLASDEQIEEAAKALGERGITVEVVEDRTKALERIGQIVPEGASLSTGASLTLGQIGFEAVLKSGDHPWQNLKAAYLAESDPATQMQMRRESTLADYYLGSVHAVALSGEIVIASMTGSQLAPYAYSARNVLWVVGAQKITRDLETAIRRVREYILPHENERMLASSEGKMGSMIGKILIFEREAAFLRRKVTMLIVKEKLGD